jgi:hypothetical protein
MPEVIHTRLGDVLEVARVRLGQNPGLEREPAGERAELWNSSAPVISSQTEIGTIGVTINWL